MFEEIRVPLDLAANADERRVIDAAVATWLLRECEKKPFDGETRGRALNSICREWMALYQIRR